jgi:hypothetical protein
MFSQLEKILDSKHLSGEAYFLIEDNGNNNVLKVLLEPNARKDLTENFKINLLEKVINPNKGKSYIPKVSTLLERDKQVFEYDSSNIGYTPIEFPLISGVLQHGLNSNIKSFDFRKDKLTSVKGVIYYLSIPSGENIVLYQHKYKISIHKSTKKSYISLNGTTLDKVNLEIIDINNTIDIFYYDNKFFTLNVNLLENKYGLMNVIQNIANQTVPKILKMGIIDITNIANPSDIFKELEDDKTSMKRLAMISKGNIIKNPLTIQQVQNVISNFPVMRNNLKIKNGKIPLTSKNKKRLFIRLLNNEASFAALDNSPFLAVEKDPA